MSELCTDSVGKLHSPWLRIASSQNENPYAEAAIRSIGYVTRVMKLLDERRPHHYVWKYIQRTITEASLMPDAHFRKAVVDFILACEALLSPSLKGSDFTKGECDTIGKYLAELCQADKPWWKPALHRRVPPEKWL